MTTCMLRRAYIWDIFSYWASPKQFFFTVPLPSTNQGNHPTLQMAFPTLVFVSTVKKKTYQWSQLGKIDPKDYQNNGAS